eukprot:2387020-Rhodomonas_salina.1
MALTRGTVLLRLVPGLVHLDMSDAGIVDGMVPRISDAIGKNSVIRSLRYQPCRTRLYPSTKRALLFCTGHTKRALLTVPDSCAP